MGDKLKPGVSVRINFVDGERPTARKFNTLSAQLETATKKLEKAIGDIYSESYPYSTLTSAKLSAEYGLSDNEVTPLTGAVTRDLDIVNLGRLIGPASNLNPHMMSISEITENVPSGVHEFTLKYRPSDIPNITFSDNVVFSNWVFLPTAMSAAGDYSVDSYGRVYCITATDSGSTVTYEVDPTKNAGGNTYQGASFNVIPDVNQLEQGTGCTIGSLDGDGRRLVTLPLITHHHYDQSGNSTELDENDLLYEYQATLPRIISDNYTLEEEIPSGFLYLKNYTKNKIYLDASYYYYSETAFLIGTEDITEDVDAGDIFGVITVGTDITTSIDDLRRKLYHSHDRDFGEPLIKVSLLGDILKLEGASGMFMPSEIANNYFPQYLHRDGYRSGVDINYNDANVLRGDLGIGVEDGGAGNYLSASGPSYKIRFFGPALANRPTIHRTVTGALALNADQGISGSAYSGSTSEGVRIQDGVLVPEGGIHSGLSSNEFAIKSIGFKELNVPLVTLIYGIDFTTYGLDTSTHRILSVSCLVRNSSDSGSGQWFQIGTNGYEAVVNLNDHSHSTSPFVLAIGATGSAWDGGNIDISGVLFFYELVS